MVTSQEITGEPTRADTGAVTTAAHRFDPAYAVALIGTFFLGFTVRTAAASGSLFAPAGHRRGTDGDDLGRGPHLWRSRQPRRAPGGAGAIPDRAAQGGRLLDRPARRWAPVRGGRFLALDPDDK